MDYLEWELERQRGALRALLGGGARDKEAPREDGAGRKLAEPGAAGGDAAGQRGRSAAPGGAGAGRPAVREAVRGAGADRPEGEGGGPDSPAGAWEQVLAGKEAASGQRGWDGPEGRAPAMARKPQREGTGPLAALSVGPGGDLPAREAEAMEPWENAGERRAGEPGGAAAAGAYTAAPRLAKRRPVWAPDPETASGGTAFWGGGGIAAARAEDGARALSRAVQRDARRYDGGFTIY